MPLTIVIAAIAALAILLIAVGISSSGHGTGVSARLERYASGKDETKKPESAASLGDLISQSAAISQLNKAVEGRDFGANLARDLARADLKLKVSEYLFIWVGGHRRHPGLHVPGRLRAPGAPEPHPPPRGRRDRLLPAPLVRPPAPGQADQPVQQAAPGHDHPHRECAAGRLVVPAGHRAGGPRGAPADLHGVRPGDPRGQPRPALRAGAREPRPPGPLGGPRADGHGHLHPVHGRREPGRDPGLHRLHDPRTGPHQGRDPHLDGPAADVRLRGGVPADRPGRVPRASSRRPSCSPCSTRR